MSAEPEQVAASLEAFPGWRPFAGAMLPSRDAGRVRALREATDDAQAILAFVRAGMASHGIDPSQVVWVIDLAPGDGERAWRVLRSLSGAAPRGPAIRYLVCCRDDAHHALLSRHSLLRPLIADGTLFLDRMGDGLPTHPLRNPVVVLAHEGLSVREQGLFAMRSGELLQAWHDGFGLLDWRAAGRRDGVHRLLSAYRHAPDDAMFTLPHGAMQVLATLLRASGGRLLLRATDRGSVDALRVSSTDAGDARRPLPVNFDAMARWHRANGGSVHQDPGSGDGRVLHIALHEPEGGRLRECLPEILSLPHPDDHAELLKAMMTLSSPTRAQCLALLRVAGDDPRALRILSQRLGHAFDGVATAAQDAWDAAAEVVDVADAADVDRKQRGPVRGFAVGESSDRAGARRTNQEAHRDE